MKFFIASAMLLSSSMVLASNGFSHTPSDSIYKTYDLDEVVVSMSAKQTNAVDRLPASVSLVSPQSVQSRQIEAIKDLSSFVPNLFIPDYGGKLTSAIYLRGVGARSSGQSIGLYVDGSPFLNKSTFDFELTDVQRIEVLRGPQGSLYGRNSMGGIMKIYTLSAFDYQGTRASLSVGNYGQLKAKLSHYAMPSEHVALSAGVYYDRNSGYFTNSYNGEKADSEESVGARLKLEAELGGGWNASYALRYDYTSQGAFPYAPYDAEGETLLPVAYNDRNTYVRNMMNNHLLLRYEQERWMFTSTTGYQFFADNMWMDQDFTQESIFTLNQKQRQHAVNQEFAFRSTSGGDYRWSFGAYGFYEGLRTTAPVTFKEDGIKNVLQPVFDGIKEDNPSMPFYLVIMDDELHIPGTFTTPAYSAAIYHESTYDNFLVKKLSVTAGVRLDYEKQSMHYESQAQMRIGAAFEKGDPAYELDGDPSVMDEKIKQDFFQIQPKVSLKYSFTPQNFVYATVSKGYKAGGYNVQMSADVMQALMQYDMMSIYVPDMATEPASLESVAAYKPEQLWNYELGVKGELFGGNMKMDAALFYMDITDVQLTKFVESGNGRLLTNAGQAKSYGAEVSVTTRLGDNLSLEANYGYTHATFVDYDNGITNYAGKYIPYAPQHTANVGIQYSKKLSNNYWIDQVSGAAQVGGAGKIYWTEENNLVQPFYASLNARLTVRKDFVNVSLWGRNLTNAKYETFYFESLGNPFMQSCKPLQFGAEIALSF